MQTVIFLFTYIAFCFFVHKKLLFLLHLYQQHEYSARRFLKWILQKPEWKLLLCSLTTLFHPLFFSLLAAAFATSAYSAPDPRVKAKKVLVMTERARALYFIALTLALSLPLFGYFLAIWLLPFTLVAANFLHRPFEQKKNRKHLDDSKQRLAEVKPIIIGITGSFGKTSVKHILGHILDMNSTALITPGGVNELMGISRTIRKKLHRGYRYFIVEMGAYGAGSIEKLCAFTPPDYGIITSVGHAHFERFKSIDTVAAAKFELADATLAKGGKMVVTEEALNTPYAKKYYAENKDRFVLVSDQEILRIEQLKEGTKATLLWEGKEWELFAPIYGLHSGRNIAASFFLAALLGIDPQRIALSLKTLPQIKHRLEVKETAQGITYIDDAYNSNPIGFQNALDLLALLGANGRRKILVTPGMIELGARHDALHAQVAVKASSIVDLALIITPQRVPTFIAPFPEEKRLLLPTFAAAKKWLQANTLPGDVILIENDLPDLYENR